ncbi:MAG: YebC/PmpR family DNA-binding transcriptional regulator [Patescibacteria group bacterium]|nr:YebC/PmpR family DNA-binding transcriptional regulator [Patescibacteria group bacterium]
MSGHSKWASIKHKKGAIDAKRGKIFTKHAKLITIAARGGGDPDMNPSLRLAIDNAKSDNVPNANIDKAIKKGTGEDKSAAVMVEASYEGYGPAGVALYIQAITDNKNRTLPNIRNILAKGGGSLGELGCVAWMFEKKGLILARFGDMDVDEAELMAIEAGAADLSRDDDSMEVYTAVSDLSKVSSALKEAGFEVESQEIAFIPKDTVKVEDKETAGKILRLMDALDDDDDVTNVSSNFDIDEGLL